MVGMERRIYRRILDLILEASALAHTIGISNLLQPGLVKELMIADILGHTVIHTKRHADAHAPNAPDVLYEYLSCIEGGAGQFDRMFRIPADKRAESLRRITRNHKIYLAVFFRHEQTRCKVIYELDPTVLLMEAERQLDRSRNDISHVSFPEQWASQQGVIVYQAQMDD
jgi:hypothetical protein